MEKRLFLAVTLSIVILAGWAALVPRLFPELAKKPPATSTSTQTAPGTTTDAGSTAAGTSPAVAATPAAPQPATAIAQASRPVPIAGQRPVETVVDTPQFTARFTNTGARLTSFRLKGYDRKKEQVELVKYRSAATGSPFMIQSADRAFNAAANTAVFDVREETRGAIRTIRYRWVGADGRGLEKVFTLREGSYDFGFTVHAIGNVPQYRVAIGPGIQRSSEAKEDNQFLTVGNGVLHDGEEHEVVAREEVAGIQAWESRPRYIGLEDNYFLAVMKPTVGGAGVFRSINISSGQKGEKPLRELYAAVNADGGRVEGTAFFGPKQADVLEAHGLEDALQFGMFGFIARMLLYVLTWLFGVTKNYGWAIVVLTIIIKIILYPLQHKSIVSMKKMQKLQPKVNALRDKYKKAKTDPEQRQKLNVEMMKLYKQEGVNPMGGCLPILLQLPIFWGFYGLLSHAIELRGAEFILWIQDLSLKDPYYITPVLMTITMFIQQWITPTTVDPAQRRIFLMMPLIFGWIFKEFPSGLVVYWLVQNLLGILQQMIMNKYWKDHPDSI